MRTFTTLCGALVCALTLTFGTAGSLAATPPNPKDPCTIGTRDSCGTTGIGYYKTYSFGTRWFGDFRNAVAGQVHTFCLDLRFWYPGAQYQYKEDTTGVLRNKAGVLVVPEKLQRMAYALWNFGRSTTPDQQAAVMLYVHTQMGDARPGEIDPQVLNGNVVALFTKIDGLASRYHGPYTIEAKLTSGLAVGRPATATVRVLAVSGAAVPGVVLTVSGRGASGLPGSVTTDASGLGRLTFTPTAGTGLNIAFQSQPLASTLPRIFVPSSAAAAANGQRLAAPASQVLSAAVTGPATKTQISASSTATPTVLDAGGQSTDKVTITGASDGYRATVAVKVFGPFQTQGSIKCDGAPVVTTSFSANGPGDYESPPVTIAKPGWYVYQEVLPADAANLGTTTQCPATSEEFKVQVQPLVRTLVSSVRVTPGTQITDQVHVEGLQGQAATVQASLYGPFASRDAIKCTAQPIWTGSITVPQDGDYTTDPFALTVPGYYTYRESIPATELVKPAVSTCNDDAETTVATASPQITTQASTQTTLPGAAITDRAVVTGLGALSAPVRVELFGPFATLREVSCTGTPFWVGRFTANGDGTYVTAPVKLTQAGYYRYRESIDAGTANDAYTTPCTETAETTFAKPNPGVTTLVSADVVHQGSTLFDRIRVSGLGRGAATIQVSLYGPFATRGGVGCTGRPYWQGRVAAQGDGVVNSPPVSIRRAGFYVYHERLTGPLTPPKTTGCSEAAETSLGAPRIITGRGDHVRYVQVAAATGSAPVRVKLAAVGVNASVLPSVIDTVQGVLAVPSDIHQLGWWRDGAAPGSRTGSTLIAGHVDSAKLGPGALVNLKNAKAGQQVEVTTADGRVHTYRVVSVRLYPKSALPDDVWSLKGAPRLVLVTCGGPFDHNVGHYLDNVVLTAVPA